MSSITDKSIQPKTDTVEVREFFNTYFTKKIEFSSNQVDSVVGFFKKRGFDENAAISVSTVLLTQAKIDNVNVFKLIDSLSGLTEVQISKLVATILNSNRSKISNIGYRVGETNTIEKRNILL
jgi:hypothetical protein